MAEYNNFEIVQGQKFSAIVSMSDESGVVLPLTGMKARMIIMYGDYDGTVGIQLTTDAGGGIVIAENKLNIKIKTAQTALLSAEKAVYEIELIDSENEVTGWLRGNITILKGKV